MFNNQSSNNGFNSFLYPTPNNNVVGNNILPTIKKEILPKEQATNPYTYGFIALQEDSTDLYYQEQPLALCLVQLLGEKGEEIQVIQLSLLPCDKERLIEGILAINKVRNFGKLAMDLPTMRWFNEDRAYSRACDLAQKKENVLSFPMLTAIKKPANLRIYQETILLPLLRKSVITYLPALSEQAFLMESIKNIGISPLAYALAGACEQAIKQQKQFTQIIENKPVIQLT